MLPFRFAKPNGKEKNTAICFAVPNSLAFDFVFSYLEIPATKICNFRSRFPEQKLLG